ncbi:4'-phosphopantetheinyl transferase superfamily protein [uncultured Salinisphaera sp.]|uniref:4'-phosphopantetheinyl transferase superfamily protein n=1 Tax=uncultured Salinisphaera sp. TaxID=359372 RepID=UPI0032B16A42
MTRDHCLEEIIAGLLPTGAVVRAGPIAPAGALPPAEAALIERAVEARRAEFASARTLARAALAALGRPVAALGASHDAGPAWPDDVTGSLTHADGVAAVAVAYRHTIGAIGIDIEGPRTLDAPVWPSVFTASERAKLIDERDAVRLFSAKEAAYKCLAGLGQATTEFLDFELIAAADIYRLRFVAVTRHSENIVVRSRVQGERIVCVAYAHSPAGQPA